MAAFKPYQDDWLLFTEAGFIAVNQADEDAAVKLFKAGSLLNPENMLPKIGVGYLHLHKLELKQAVKAFEEVLQKEPSNEMARAFLGICLSLIPGEVDHGEKVLKQAHGSHDPMIKNLAETAMDFVKKFVKKAAGPAGNG